MCTVTYIPGKEAVFITSSRDEQRTRGKAYPPDVHQHAGENFLYPVDSEAGGSWIAVKQSGDAMVLLNGGFEAHTPQASYRCSRGAVFMEILQQAHLCQGFDALPMEGVQPFTLIIFENRLLYECRWNGQEKFQAKLNAATPYIWSSVTLYDKEMRSIRETWFKKWLDETPEFNAQHIIQLHKTGNEQNKHFAFLMERPTVHTTSITSISLQAREAIMYHSDVLQQTASVNHLQINAATAESITHPLRYKAKTFFIKLFHWEYWPFYLVYAPIYAYWLWLCAKSKSFFFFNASNPLIKNGGFLLESKKEIYDILPQNWYPLTIFCDKKDPLRNVLHKLEEKKLRYPLIAKPDIGMRGMAVKKIHSETELREYLAHTRVDFLLQECIEYPNEAGIFFYKIPGQSKGHISGIVGKFFVTLEGDGVSTMEQLLLKNDRYLLQLPALKASNGGLLKKVLAPNEKYTLVPIGNHARGALFLNISNKITQQLTDSINNICNKIPDFYYGRIDIKYTTWEDLCAGKNFSIIELNGAGSEPTHIYDPSQSVFFAWKEIIRHWKILYQVSAANHRLRQIPYMSTKAGLAMLRDNRKHIKLLTN